MASGVSDCPEPEQQHSQKRKMKKMEQKDDEDGKDGKGRAKKKEIADARHESDEPWSHTPS